MCAGAERGMRLPAGKTPSPPAPGPPLHAVERWIVQKKSRMQSLPYRQRDRASRTGYIPADEDTLGVRQACRRAAPC